MEPPIWGFLQPCLLLLLAEGPAHGYSLMEELNRRQLLPGDVDVGNLYRALRRMEAADLVTSAWSTHERGPNKRVYQISDRGEEVLRHWAGALEERTRLLRAFLDEYHRVFGQPTTVTPPPRPEDQDNFM
jgi:poly-beta-hydroxybutyrate-responsive repressor